jgi:RNA ligase
MWLFDLIDENLYRQMVAEGYVRENPHPSLPLTILGYTEKAQFERKWNDATINCRGLIVDHNREIVARPWKKFFNAGEGNILFDMNDRVEVTDKMDGSLGILYPLVDEPKDGMGYAISTRGSFTSDQAIHATRIWQDKYALKMCVFSKYALMRFTFLFEIIYPENRIVLNYGELDDLVLLGAVHTDLGYYIGPNDAATWLQWDGPVAPVFSYKTMQEVVNAPDRHNAEGFVLRSGTKMIKVKQTDYVELHKLVTNLSERTVWSALRDGKTVEELAVLFPDEFHEFIRTTGLNLLHAHLNMEYSLQKEFNRIRDSLPDMWTRKDFAMAAKGHPDIKYLFMILDDNYDSLREKIWEELKPKAVDKT